MAPGANIGKDLAIFEAVHGTAPDIAGKGLANPTALTLAAVQLLEYVGAREPAARIRRALDGALGDAAERTRDLGGQADTATFTRAVCKRLEIFLLTERGLSQMRRPARPGSDDRGWHRECSI